MNLLLPLSSPVMVNDTVRVLLASQLTGLPPYSKEMPKKDTIAATSVAVMM